MGSKKQFQIGHHIVVPEENALLLEQQDSTDKITLQPKFIEVLCYLAEQYPRVIPRAELIEKIWQGNEYVGEKALTNAIWHLRKSFNDCEQGVVETIRKVGYKLTIEPKWLESPDDPSPSEVITSSANNVKPVYSYLAIFTCVVLMTIWHYWSEHHTPKVQQSVSITNEPGSELFVSPSPNGKQIVYAWTDKKGATDLYLKQVHAPKLTAKKITHDGLVQGISTWSPSGQYLYFTKKSSAERVCSVVRLDVKALEEKILANCPYSGGYYYMDTSPDGKILAYHGRQNPNHDSGIYFLDLEELTTTRFSCSENCPYRDRDVSFSPDGQHLAITRRSSSFSENIYIVNLDTQQEVQVTSQEEDIVGFTWSPSGQYLVFASQTADVRRGFIYNIDDNSTTAININGFSYPKFAKLSGELFYQLRTEKYHISKLAIEEQVVSSPFPLIQSSYSHRYPSYSEAVNKIVYTSNTSGHYELWLADVDGENQQQLTELSSSVQYPRLSHSGDKIAFVAASRDSTGDKLYVYDLNSNRIQAINTGSSKHNRPTWRFDDNALVVAMTKDGITQLHEIDLVNANVRQLSNDGGRLGYINQNQQLIYSRVSGGIWQRDLANNKPRKSLIAKSQLNSIYSWQPSQSSVYFYNKEHQQVFISKYDLDTQEVSQLIRIPESNFSKNGGLSFVSSGPSLLFSFVEIQQSDINQLIHPLLD